MQISSYKTHKITTKDTDILHIIKTYVPEIPEKSVLAVTSKIVSICEGSVVAHDQTSKHDLIRQSSEYFIPSDKNKYNVTLTVTHGMLVASAGIDESNSADGYVLWPQDIQRSANEIRAFLRETYGVHEVGVVITDSKTTPLRWGVTGMAIGYSGFKPLKDLIGTPDIFGRLLKMTKVNIVDSLAGAAVFVMGESEEQTPIAVVSDIPHIEFHDEDPSPEELASLRIELPDDLYASLLMTAPWEKGSASY